MKKRNLLLSVLVLLFITVTSLSFAYWDNLTVSKNQTINLGEGTNVEVVVNASAQAGKTLIPSGAVLGPNDVHEYVFTYNVKLSKEVSSPLNLNVVTNNVTIGGVTTNAGLVNIGIVKAASTVNNVDVLVTVTVTLTAPSTQEIYNAIVNQPIAFDLVFSATAS